MDEGAKGLIEKKLVKNGLLMKEGRMALAHLSEGVARRYGEELCRPLTGLTLKKLMKECKTLEASDLPLLAYPLGFGEQECGIDQGRLLGSG